MPRLKRRLAFIVTAIASAVAIGTMGFTQMQPRRDIGVIVLAIREKGGTMLFNPDPEAEIHGGDYLIAMGLAEQLRRLETLLTEVRV